MIWSEIRRVLVAIINLRDTTDYKGTIDSIRKSIEIRGYNVWILACGAMLASIGLDQNSVAVIIGAMLISPLMSPILGIGLSVAINDREHLMLALENFFIAVAASLLVSTFYFLITPFGEAGPEIMARTKPTILDVFIAIFGGIAGIVAGSRKDKTNAIPGVAIATALMPPICVSGYGIAKADLSIFAGAFYLFFINAVFISLSTYAIVRFLRFPYVDYVDDVTRRKAFQWITILALLTVLPSAYILYNVIQEVRTKNNIQLFISREIDRNPEHKVSQYEVSSKDSMKEITMFIGGKAIDEDSVAYLQTKKSDYGLDNFDLRFLQVNIREEEVIDKSTAQAVRLAKDAMMGQLDTIRSEVDSVHQLLDNLLYPSVNMDRLANEAMAAFPDLEGLVMAPGAIFSNKENRKDTASLFLATWKTGLGYRTRKKEEQRFQNWLRSTQKDTTFQVVFR